MYVRVVNCGSATLKFQLIDTTKEEAAPSSERHLAYGMIERIGSQTPSIFRRLATHTGTLRLLPTTRRRLGGCLCGWTLLAS